MAYARLMRVHFGGLALSTPVTLLAVPGLYAAIKGRRKVTRA